MAEALRARNICRGARVGVCSEHSVELVAAILALWSIGAVYVPLDPELPQRRLDAIVDDANLAVVLVSAESGARFDFPSTLPIGAGSRPSYGESVESQARPQDAAYAIYTSGSTGAPKGVELTHAAVVNAIRASVERCSLDAGVRQLYRTSIGFDLSVYDIFCPLFAGGTIVFAARTVTMDPRSFVACMIERSITSILVGPRLLALLLDEEDFARCTALKIVTCGGEALSIGLCQRFFAMSAADLYNLYGPSEATMLVTLHRCSPRDADYGEETAPLGAALPNTAVTVRDENLVPVRPGGTGEIVIGGLQVASGYMNNPDQTAARFVASAAYPGERLYRTGDLARLHADGSIIYLGRNDKQVKIRGQRVEPAEVAAAIERLEGVSSAAVIARRVRSTADADPFVLVAYVALRAGVTVQPEGLRRALRAHVPLVMLPSEIVLMDALPLTVSGKVDEAALAAGDTVRAETTQRAEPAAVRGARGSKLFEQLRGIWETLLGIEGIADDDDFYDLGGDSLLVVRLMNLLEDTFGRRVSFADFFDSMTIANLAELLLNDVAELCERDLVVFNEAGSLPPLVFLHGDFAGGMYAWSLAKLFGPDQPVSVIPPHGTPGRPPVSTVEQMARDVVATITRHHPVGPIRIAGYCFAGLVAFEAARLLRSAGRVVLDVVVVGVGAENAAFAGLRAALNRLPLARTHREAAVRVAIESSLCIERFIRRCERDHWAVIGSLLEWAFPRRTPGAGQGGEDAGAWEAYVAAHRGYVPGPYAARVTVLWPAEQPVENGDVRRDWARVASDVEVVSVPGTHDSALFRHLDDIVRTMKARFLAGSNSIG